MKLAPLLSAAWLAVAAMPGAAEVIERQQSCLLYTSPSPRD